MRRADLKDHLRRDNGQAFEHVWDPTRKDDPKNKQVSVVPLSPLTRQIISTLPVIDISDSKDWIFSNGIPGLVHDLAYWMPIAISIPQR